jgi:hypothetical protein
MTENLIIRGNLKVEVENQVQQVAGAVEDIIMEASEGGTGK